MDGGSKSWKAASLLASDFSRLAQTSLQETDAYQTIAFDLICMPSWVLLLADSNFDTGHI